MSKKSLLPEQKVTDATAFETDPKKLVAEATEWAMALWGKVHKGMGDTQENSMHAAARLAQVTPNTIWKLRYRKPRKIDASIYFKLRAAHDRHVVSVEGKIAENLQVLRTLPATPDRARLVAEMEEFLRNSASEEARGASRTNRQRRRKRLRI